MRQQQPQHLQQFMNAVSMMMESNHHISIRSILAMLATVSLIACIHIAGENRSYLRSITSLDSDHHAQRNGRGLMQTLQRPVIVPESGPLGQVPLKDGELSNVLIVVTTCRKNFEERVGALARTWSNSSATVWYFVGTAAADPKNDDMTERALKLGVPPSSVKVIPSVRDDEYPPVRRHAAMIEFVAQEIEPKAYSHFEWILKVDDDTYVNLAALRDFVASKSTKKYQVYGAMGYGRPGADREGLRNQGFRGAFCMGGPGYVMTTETWKKTAQGMATCVRNADYSKRREALWHSDVLIGLCVYKQTRVTCSDQLAETVPDQKALSSKLFRQNYNASALDFVDEPELSSAITMHPLKDPQAMARQHVRTVEHYRRRRRA